MLNQIFILLALVIFVFTSVMYGLHLYVDYRDRKNIHILQSKVSILKLMLKTKMKSFDQKFQKNLKLLNPENVKFIHEKLSAIKNLDLQQAEDYTKLTQYLMEILNEIDRLVAKLEKLEVELKPVEVNQFEWQRILNFDFRLAVLLYEIVSHTEILNAAISYYNSSQKKEKKHFKVENVIKLPDFEVLHEKMTEFRQSQQDESLKNQSGQSDVA